jgi:hypothetical protein
MSTTAKTPAQAPHCAFTRLEFLACLGATALLMAIILPALANSTSRGDRVVCFNNLRQIGAGFTQFGLEHRNLMAWSVPVAEGGNRDHPMKNHSFMQFSILSNFVGSPKVLMDPADGGRSRRVATSWERDQRGGLLHINFHNNAVSYFLGLDGNFTTPSLPLAGDRNVRHMGVGGCSSGVAPAARLFELPGGVGTLSTPSVNGGWTNAVHGLSGNVVLYDGSVHEVDTPGLLGLVLKPVADDLNVYHILLPF